MASLGLSFASWLGLLGFIGVYDLLTWHCFDLILARVRNWDSNEDSGAPWVTRNSVCLSIFYRLLEHVLHLGWLLRWLLRQLPGRVPSGLTHSLYFYGGTPSKGK